jgi:hypothetical protein
MQTNKKINLSEIGIFTLRLWWINQCKTPKIVKYKPTFFTESKNKYTGCKIR